MSSDEIVNGLYPHLYPPPTSLKLPKGVIRVFGVNWAFAVKGTSAALAQDNGEALMLTGLYGAKAGVSNFSFHQNFFTLDIYERYPPENDTDCYPLIGNGLVPPATLRVQKILRREDADNPDLRQLLQGRIVVPSFDDNKRQKLLALMRRELGLLPPSGQEQLSIILDPDGFAIHAALQLPWEDKPTDGWFKVVGGGIERGAKRIEPGLCLALDADMPDGADAMRAIWEAAGARLARLITGGSADDPVWLGQTAQTPVSPERLFWPARRKPGGSPQNVYVDRAANGPLHLTGRPMTLRLAPASHLQHALAALEIVAERVVVSRESDGKLTLASADKQAGSLLHYHFTRRTDPDNDDTAEWVELGEEQGTSKPRRIDLAVPLTETAKRIREASGMPPRDLVAEDAAAKARNPAARIDPVGPLWTFAPISQGLLHFPMPDATLEGLETLLEANSSLLPSEKTPDAQPGDDSGIAGALLLGNNEAMAMFEPHHRAWHLAVTDASSPWFCLAFKDTPDSGWVLEQADIHIGGCLVALDGAIPIIPFAQTTERLLPDQDERAARLTGIRAVSPELLRGIEARMWNTAMAHPDAPFVQARLAVLDLRLTAPRTDNAIVKLSGKVQLGVRIASRRSSQTEGKKGGKKGNTQRSDASLRPWLWTRHHALPTVQTHAMALSGAAACMPSVNLELFPFARVRAKEGIVYSFENALDMGVTTPQLIISQPSKNGPTYAAAWQVDGGQISEIGMAVLSLPSVTLHPGLTVPGDEVHIPPPGGANWSWPLTATAKSPVSIEIRHDLAWRDAYHAAVTLAPESDDGIAAVGGAFTPLPTNGPQHEDATSWRGAWAATQRQAALAATDQRAMVVHSAKPGYQLSGFSGIKRVVIERLTLLDWLTVAVNAAKEPVSLVEAGAFSIEIENGPTLRLAGLPATSDLLGVSGLLGDENFAFGTLVAARNHGKTLTDQGGLTSDVYAAFGAVLQRKVNDQTLFAVPGARNAAGPMGEIAVWFTDVPAKGLDQPPETWLASDNDHIQGFRWALGTPGAVEEDWINVEPGIWFNARRLSAIEVKDDKAVAVTFTGVLAVRDQGGFLCETGVVEENNRARIIVKGSSTGSWSWTFNRGPVAFLPLEREGGEGPTALLELGATPLADALHFEMLGAAMRVPLAEPESDPLVRTARPDATPGATAGAVFGLKSVELRLASARPEICVEAAFAFAAVTNSALKLGIAGTLLHPRYRDGTLKTHAATLTLQSAASTVSYSLGVTTSDVFAAGVLALSFAIPETTDPATVTGASWLAQFTPAAVRGSLIALIRPSAAGFASDSFHIDCEMDLIAHADKPPLRLVISARPAKGASSVRLEGEWHLANARAGAGLTHDVALRFDGSAVASVGPEVLVTAHARHALKIDQDKADFAVVQAVHITADNVDFSCGILASPGELQPTMAAVLPGHSKAGTQVLPWCAAFPPVARAAVLGAEMALAEALGGGERVWTDALLTEPTRAAAPPVGGEPIGNLMALIKNAADVSIYGLSFPPAWEMDRRSRLRNYQYYLKNLIGQLDKLLVAAPSQFLDSGRRRGYRLTGPDALSEKLTVLAEQSSVSLVSFLPDRAEDRAALAFWAARLRGAAARWAEVATLHHYDADGAMQTLAIGPATSRQAVARHGDRRWQADAPFLPDPRRTAIPAHGENLSANYLPMASSALHLRYVYDAINTEEANGAALAASVIERQWSLTAPSAQGSYSASHDYWLSSRARILFRQRPSDPKRLAAAMDAVAQHAAASGFAPATQVMSGPPAEAMDGVYNAPTYFAPSHFVMRDIAARAGARQVRRLGLAARQASGNQAPLAASELPFHARIPRPPITAKHDWPRASDFEAQPFAASLQPEALLYGPRMRAPFDPVPPNALTREPRSRNAAVARLAAPAGGIFDRRWDGAIVIDIMPLDSAQPVPDWRADGMWVHIGTSRFRLAADAADGTLRTAEAKGIRRFIFRDVQDDAAKPLPRLFDYLAGLSLSAPMRLECEMLGGDDEGMRLTRLAVFEALAMPRGRAVETPILLRFQDPAYDDILTLPAKMVEDAQKMFCADRQHILPHDRFHVAWRRFPKSSAAIPTRFFLQATRSIRRRNGKLEGYSFKLKPIDAFPAGTMPAAFAAIDCATLMREGELPVPDDANPRPDDDPVVFEGLVEGDRLEVRDAEHGGATVLTFEVSKEPIYPASPSGFALLRLAGDGSALGAPMQARSPTPTTIELIDPRDLFSGIARFRAIYQWRFFEQRPPEGSASRAFYMLQKFSGDGGSYLPAALADWIVLPDDVTDAAIGPEG